MSRPRKILVVGASSFQRKDDEVVLQSVDWIDISRVSNLRDYDIVVLNVANPTSVQVSWRRLETLLDPSTLEEILRPDGMVVVVGDPRFSIPDISSEHGEETPFLAWSGLDFHWDDAPGSTLELDATSDSQWHRIASHIRGFRYSLNRVEVGPYYSTVFARFTSAGGISLDAEVTAWARTRYGYSVAFAVRVVLRTLGDRRQPSREVFGLGPLVFVPELDLSPDETIQLVLSDLCDVETRQPEPEWLAPFSAPGQAAIDSDLSDLRGELALKIEALSDASARRDAVRRCLDLLYQRGEALESSVRDVMRRLGADVEDPQDPGQEDGWVSADVADVVYEGVLEVKGTRGKQLGEDGLKQLATWIDRGIRLRNKKYKGILVTNHEIEVAPSERGDAFSSSFRDAARLHEFAVIRSFDLYVALLRMSDGRLKQDEFWSKVFATNGVFDGQGLID